MNKKGPIKKPTYINGDFRKGIKLLGSESRLVYGTSGIGGVWGEVDERESIECILYALEEGVSVFDTSSSYKNAQEYIGKALKEWDGKLPFISTKVGRLKANRADQIYLDYSRAGMRKSIFKSLELLGTDYIDLLFLHEPQLVPVDNIDSILETLISFQEQGVVGMLGIGGNPDQSFWPYVKKNYFDVVSTFLKFNACTLEGFGNEIQKFKEEDIFVYAASPLHMGLLGSQYKKFISGAEGSKWITKKHIKNAITVKKIAEKYGLSLSDMALRYLFSMHEANRIVLGASNMEETKQSLKAWNKGKLPESVFIEITDTILE